MAFPTEKILAGCVKMVARIRHAQGVKAAVSALILDKRFPSWSSAFWHPKLRSSRQQFSTQFTKR